MFRVFTSQQLSALNMIRSRCNKKVSGILPEILVLVSPLGAGASACISSICANHDLKAVVLSTQSAEFSFYPSEWLAEYFGLFSIKRPQGRLSQTLISMTKLVNLELIVIEDFQDLKAFHPRHLVKVIDDLANMSNKVPGLRALISINSESLDWLKSILNESSLIPFFITLEPLRNDRSFKHFIAQHVSSSNNVVREILDTPSVVDMLYQSADGSIGRLVMMLDMLAGNIEASSSGELLSSVDYVINLLQVRRK
jgi:hypothetical protein